MRGRHLWRVDDNVEAGRVSFCGDGTQRKGRDRGRQEICFWPGRMELGVAVVSGFGCQLRKRFVGVWSRR